MDYRAFLTPPPPLVLPFFGGTRVDAADRRLRIDPARPPSALGWWRFAVERRLAVPLEPAAAPDLTTLDLPTLRGHWCAGWIAASGRDLSRIPLPCDDEPAAFARVTARRWYSGDWLLASTEFEDEPELAARQSLEQLAPLGAIRDAVPSLRAAYGVALGVALAREAQIAVDPHELVPFALDIAERGRAVVHLLFDDLIAARQRAETAARERTQRAAALHRVGHAVASARGIERARTATQRADDALAAAGARLLTARHVARGAELDVTYEVNGVRIISLVDADSLQILDPGVCLDDAHEVLTLDAMPSVIREAIASHRLNITRRA